MSSCTAFHEQLASIMEVLANTAVVEICKLVDDGYALLRLEMSQYKKENEDLKRKLHTIEFQIARGQDKTSTRDSSANHRSRFVRVCDSFQDARTDAGNMITEELVCSSWKGAETVKHNEDVAVQPIVVNKEEMAYLPNIKKERVEEDLTIQSSIRISGRRVVEQEADAGEAFTDFNKSILPSCSTEKCSERDRTDVVEQTEEQGQELSSIKEERTSKNLRCADPREACMVHDERVMEPGTLSNLKTVLFKQSSSSEEKKELVDQQRSTFDFWEDAELTVLSTETLKDGTSQRLQNTGPKSRGKRLGTEESDCLMYERNSQAPFDMPQVGPVAEASSLCYSCIPESSSDSLSFLSELQMIPSVVHSEHTHAHDNSNSEQMHPEMSYPSHTDLVRHSAADSKSDSPHLPDTNTSTTGSVKILHRSGSKDRLFFNAGFEKAVSCPKATEAHQSNAEGRPFICAQCGKRFTQSCHLKVHKRVHTGEKPFSCVQCGKRFSQSSHIKRHQRVHTGEKPFRCMLCGKQFAHSSNLKVHQSVHSRHRPLK